jgi:serine/threonine protein kinase
MPKNKPWTARWRELSRLGQGGHGTATLVEPLDSSVPEGQYVLKVQHSPNDLERRARMYREVVALETLNHPGVQRVIESNAKNFADVQQRLYLVTEYIEGPTLEERIGRERPTMADALALLMRLTDIVSYCHFQEVVHRDIKPDNVVLRSDAVADPVLLDFGLSFNREAAEESPLTAAGQHLGNRFLVLPELQGSSGNKRDPRSDLTLLCGVLFFVLSGERPDTLLDEKSRMPHQRPGPANEFGSLPANTRTHLNRLFDMGFRVTIDQRFQSAEQLQASLRSIANSTTDTPVQNTSDLLSSLRDRLSGATICIARSTS